MLEVIPMTVAMDPRTSVPPTPPPASPPARRSPGGLPVWGWVLIALGIAGTALMAVVVLVGINMLLTHDLLDEHFSTSQGEFLTGANEGHTFAIDDGAYVITSRSANAGGAFTFANLARTAYAVSADVDVVEIPADPEAFVGIACAAPGGVEGYYLVVRGSGPGVALVRITQGALESPEVLAVDESADITNVRSMSLDCTKWPVGDTVDLVGYVNGEQVLTATDPYGIDGFDTVVLHFSSPDAGASEVFDNVRAVVPE